MSRDHSDRRRARIVGMTVAWLMFALAGSLSAQAQIVMEPASTSPVDLLVDRDSALAPFERQWRLRAG